MDKQGVHPEVNHDTLKHEKGIFGAGTATDHPSEDAVKGLPANATELAPELPHVAGEGSAQEEQRQWTELVFARPHARAQCSWSGKAG